MIYPEHISGVNAGFSGGILTVFERIPTGAEEYGGEGLCLEGNNRLQKGYGDK